MKFNVYLHMTLKEHVMMLGRSLGLLKRQLRWHLQHEELKDELMKYMKETCKKENINI